MLTQYQQFFTGRPTEEIAQSLLGKQIIYTNSDGTKTGGLIVETEAYLGENDSASHAYNGRRTNYSESLYGNPGNIYLYQIRGHYCFDVVVQDAEEPQGVLIRGLEPTINQKQMAANRGMTSFNISNGPAKLVQALGIHSRALDGKPLETSPLTIQITGGRQPQEITTTSRIGVNLKGKDGRKPYRFYVKGNPYVSGLRKREMNLANYGWEG
ncbi:MAG: DNA-3-methyladenine glycosylase [Limosilactobacillus sp.]|uniref:DNA-3-methyladenine glycosylase n=1 Tax=Limosilactobacillus sp. TaxID=2773925 RepID=UPI0025BDC312|nr:DNA-3-methyladenine glycosylase [Limosilactobacillus sp.]MCI1975297.1 DNA-3-methyladenine glycosylase [Limosilactobacillus sp.]MCI2030397.1 DNA-3-methyladenine glycosylase [Limosilactobacillus sp.]